MTVQRSAALPMYDFVGLRAATDTFWSAVREELQQAGELDVPAHLTRDRPYAATWQDPGLLLGQACQYPLSQLLPPRPTLVAVPGYAVAGCQGSRYTSAIIVRSDDQAQTLLSLAGRCCGFNEQSSNSGYNLLRLALARAGARGQFFSATRVTGSHLESVQAVAAGQIDVAAIDCVSFAHIQRQYPALERRVRLLEWTPSSPGLPYITAATSSELTMQRLRFVLQRVMAAPGLAEIREALFLDQMDFNVDDSYTEIQAMVSEAYRLGYPEIV